MKIGVIPDTHGYFNPRIKTVFESEIVRPGLGWSALAMVAILTTITVLPALSSAGPASSGLSCQNLLINGGFEREGGWVIGNTPRPVSFTTTQVKAGQQAARLGIT
ncbi:MAG: hypothetical protein ACE5NP_13940, partial [Anaerolineae bacterium]